MVVFCCVSDWSNPVQQQLEEVLSESSGLLGMLISYDLIYRDTVVARRFVDLANEKEEG